MDYVYPMQLYFIRHGQSTNNKLHAVTGSDEGRCEDAELTGTGRRQAELTAAFLTEHHLGFTRIYTSLMVRAAATAAIIADALVVPLQAWEEIHESGGIFLEESGKCIGRPGKPRSYFERHHPTLQLPARLDETGWWNRPHEARAQTCARARGFVNELKERHRQDPAPVAIVSHGDFYNCLLGELLGPATAENTWFHLNNTGISLLEFEGVHLTVRYLNRTDHLPPELVT